jgi:hypothetical protein
LEDNGLLKRSVADQELIGKTLNDLGMRMGVFVIDGGDNWKVSLTTGKQELVDVFVKTSVFFSPTNRTPPQTGWPKGSFSKLWFCLT